VPAGPARRLAGSEVRAGGGGERRRARGGARRPTAPFWLNAELWLEGQLLGVVDGYLKGLGLGWEVDSRRHRAGAPEFDHTLARHDAFLGAGLGLLHVTPRRARLLGPAYADVVVCAAQARQRLQAPEPAGLVVAPRGPLIGVDGRRARGGST